MQGIAHPSLHGCNQAAAADRQYSSHTKPKAGCIPLPVVPIPQGDVPVHTSDPTHVSETPEPLSARECQMKEAVESMSTSTNAAKDAESKHQAQDKPDSDSTSPGSNLSPTLEADSPTDTCTVRAEISIERLNSQLREPSPEPDSGFQWGESARRSLGALTFAEQLAETIQRAPERRAERLADQLKEICVEEASMGLNSCTWDVPIPSSSRSFVNQVAREFAFNVETMGFERIEWWNGREWKQSQGRYHILHDTVYDKIHMRLRVRWPDRLQDHTAPLQHHDQQNAPISETQAALSQQIQQTLALQRQMLQAAMVSHVQQCPSPENDVQGPVELPRKQAASTLFRKLPELKGGKKKPLSSWDMMCFTYDIHLSRQALDNGITSCMARRYQ